MEHIDGHDEPPVVVVMVPLPAQGHLNPLLNFSRLLSGKGIPVHFTGSPVHNRQAKHRAQGWDPSTMSNIYFHDFPLPPFQSPDPDPNTPSNFPIHLQPAFEASLHLHEPVSQLLHSLSSTARRVIVVHDPLMSFAAKEASSIFNCEAYVFTPISTFACLFYMLEYFPKLNTSLVPYDLPPLLLDGFVPQSFTEFVQQRTQFLNCAVGNLYNTCRPIEGPFLDLLGQEEILGKKKQWAVGPLNQLETDNHEGSRRSHMCFDWLDEQPLDSVLYVSFGTMTSFSDEQINELAIGLERSGQRFIWVLREADKGDIYAEAEEDRRIQVPDGYEARVEGRGMIVRDWAPQVEILANPSTGGFLTHCGWNSCMESMSMGLPMVAWPMHSEQPCNSMLVTQVLKVGVIVRKWASREELVSSAAIESAVRRLMVSEEGNDMRRRAKELGFAVRQAASDDGTSRAELDSFIKHISR